MAGIIKANRGSLVSTKGPELHHIEVGISVCPMDAAGKAKGNGDPDTQWCMWCQATSSNKRTYLCEHLQWWQEGPQGIKVKCKAKG